MRKWLVLPLLCGLIISCNDTNSDGNTDGVVPESSENGIIEYDLNENRLSAVEFNNELSLIQQAAYNQINVLFMSDPANIVQNYDNAVFELELKSTDLGNIEASEGGEAFKTALMDLLTFYREELNTGFKTVMPLLEIEQEKRSQAEQYEIIDYDEQFAAKEEELFKVIMTEQEKFASENNFQIGG